MLRKIKSKIDKAIKVLKDNLSDNSELLHKIFDSFLEIRTISYKTAFYKIFDDQEDLPQYEKVSDVYSTLGLLLTY